MNKYVQTTISKKVEIYLAGLKKLWLELPIAISVHKKCLRKNDNFDIEKLALNLELGIYEEKLY